jgi:hypothetical protein
MSTAWQSTAERRLGELDAIAKVLYVHLPTDFTDRQLPYYISIFLARIVADFATAFRAAGKGLSPADIPKLDAAYRLWCDDAGDLAASLALLPAAGDYFAPVNEAFPNGEAGRDIGALILEMETLAGATTKFGVRESRIARRHLQLLEVLEETQFFDAQAAMRDLSAKIQRAS